MSDSIELMLKRRLTELSAPKRNATIVPTEGSSCVLRNANQVSIKAHSPCKIIRATGCTALTIDLYRVPIVGVYLTDCAGVIVRTVEDGRYVNVPLHCQNGYFDLTKVTRANINLECTGTVNVTECITVNLNGHEVPDDVESTWSMETV